MAEPCHIIGVLDNGPEGLHGQSVGLMRRAQVVIGVPRTFALFEDLLPEEAQRLDLTGHLDKVPQWVQRGLQAEETVLVLATGDPLCHGIGSYLVKKLGLDACQIHPNTSVMQWAFARLGLPWQKAQILSAHTADCGAWQPGLGPEHPLTGVMQSIQQQPLLGIFTSPENDPARIAQAIQAAGMGEHVLLHVAQQLLLDDERVERDLSPATVAAGHYAQPNVMIVENTAPQRLPLFGLEDASYQQRKPDKGLITKKEVRVVTLAQLRLHRESIVWDIGAGSGSIGLEAARMAGHVYAIEKNGPDREIMEANRQQMGCLNYSAYLGEAPAGLENWPDPDAVVIGGSGGHLAPLLALVAQRLLPEGRLVMNFVTLENLTTALDQLQRLGMVWELIQMQISRSQPILEMHRMQAENPVWILTARHGT
ncbi:precorrin-6Y C5,15-methyltransferase (decarboxylating) [Magnetococcus marinus MC-1]|uniref:Precorrin-6Y C5,15-methyltransferase (Decarboxylating) n=1 Tax=Magnetococcus marinus (strain ATCC BAA-1437 / JCM 17883 / MC-1) TaxID=156889 RepID=A0LCC9_MAGMM|nr:bifunctional cobalt-precorrin-7 (C(5))-methyltransferase/cobalt-precorrin-6B (C(15))-methyltransferase [Magnetococcus marinus]ABK45622.1 precorrin-6Y C5,15-methyltransferase (decarboxylating) [Magnetococcus marinus MC-1]